jgi:hypothetical protein
MPLDKQRLVSRLQLAGEVVAATGDGTLKIIKPTTSNCLCRVKKVQMMHRS